MNNILDNELVNSVKDTIKNRLSSYVYGTYIIYWAIFHWEFIFTMLFVSEDKIWNATQLLKNDYLMIEFFNYKTIFFWLWWILPALLTWLTIWKFSEWIILPFYKKELETETSKSLFRILEEKKIEKSKLELEKESVERVSVIVQKAKEEKKIKDIDPTINWNVDYLKFKDLGYSATYSHFLNRFYSGEKYLHQLNPDQISYFDALGLIKIGGNMIESLTEKGRFFALKVKEERG